MIAQEMASAKERKQWHKILSKEYIEKQQQIFDNSCVCEKIQNNDNEQNIEILNNCDCDCIKQNSLFAPCSMDKDRALYYPPFEDSDCNENNMNDKLGLINTVINRGSDDKWRIARTIGEYRSGIHGFNVYIMNDAKSSNTWRICIGILPVTFSSKSERIWVGAQYSWGYIGIFSSKKNQIKTKKKTLIFF